MNKTKTVILFSGKIYSNCFDKFIESTRHIETIKIASIWDSEDNNYIQQLIDNNFIIIKNDSEEQKLFVPQFVTIVNGMNFIKENYGDVEFVLRTRFDVLSYDYNNYLEKSKHLYSDKITVISGIQYGESPPKIYFLDIITCGKINDMFTFYSKQLITDDKRYPEKFLLENYSNKTNLTHDEIRTILNFSLDICIQYRIEFFWIRPDGYIKVIHNLCNCEDNWV